MKKSVSRVLPLFAMSVVVACSGRFQSHPTADVSSLTAVDDDDQPVIHSEVQGQHGTYQVVRYSKAITLKNVTAKKDKDDDQFTVDADLSFRGRDEGSIEMIGQPDSSGDTVLVPKDPNLKDKFKAKVTCTSDDGSCDNYFIDFFAKEGQTFYVDQYIQDAAVLDPITVDPTDVVPISAPTATLPTIPVLKPLIQNPSKVQAQAPRSTTTTTTTTTSSTVKKIVQTVPTSVQKSVPVRNPAPPTAPTPTLPNIPVLKALPSATTTAADDEDEEDIPDASPGRYVGTSDKEIVNIFESPAVVTPVKPDIKPIPMPPTPVQKPSPVQDSAQDQMGTPDPVQAINQAIGLPSKGRLQNATSLLDLAQDENYPLKIMWPEKKRYYSTQAMASFLKKLGDFTQTLSPDNKLILSDVSTLHGGPVITNGKMGHKGHQNGNDADVSYLVKDSNAVLTKIVNGQRLSRELVLKDQWALMKAAYKTGQLAVVFMDPVIKHGLCYEAQQEGDLKNSSDRGIGYETLRRIYPLSGHANHFHVRIKCGAGDATCRDQNWKYADSGCFTGTLQKKIKDEDDNG